eukprot:1509864-Prorocentrum_lima.AAC.1
MFAPRVQGAARSIGGQGGSGAGPQGGGHPHIPPGVLQKGAAACHCMRFLPTENSEKGGRGASAWPPASHWRPKGSLGQYATLGALPHT